MGLFKRKRRVKEAEVVYELKPGGHYLIEFRTDAVSNAVLARTHHQLREWGIEVIFVPNLSHHRAFEPVPAKPTKP